ncbi:MAG: chromate transporter, partial [Bdellovibrionales bacterium]|nr:chromate transporter [Bdellovibrionales bacterium]
MDGIQKHKPVCTLKELGAYFFKLGYMGFGGPAALVQYMERDLVEERKWITEEEYAEGFALAQLSPGPLAAQLAIYLGWVRFKNLGATVCALAFVLPSFVICSILAILYVENSELPWIQPVFYVVGAA